MSGEEQQQNQQQQQPPPFMPPAGFAGFASMFPGGMPNFNFGNFMAAGVGHPRLHGDNTDEMISAIESNIYRDNSKMTEADVDGELRNKRVSSRKEPTFPMKLHQMLSDPDAEGVIVWLPHGRAWKLVKADQFERVLLPRYFDHGNISSFMRQVNGWDFRRVVKGVDEQSYYHELFLRGMPHLCKMMTRTKKSKKKPGICSPKMLSITPDFYRMDPLPGCEGFVPPPAASADDDKKDCDDDAAKKGDEEDSSKPTAATNSIAGMPPGMPGFMPGMPMAAQMTFFNSMMMGANPNFLSQLGGMPPLPAASAGASAAPADTSADGGDAAAPADEEETAEETADVSV